MPTETRANDPVYTIYAGDLWNKNNEFFRNNQQAPPPKYEDVINDRPGVELPPPQSLGTLEEAPQNRVVFISHAYKYPRFLRVIVTVFFTIFCLAFVSFFVKFFKM